MEKSPMKFVFHEQEVADVSRLPLVYRTPVALIWVSYAISIGEEAR